MIKKYWNSLPEDRKLDWKLSSIVWLSLIVVTILIFLI